MLVNRYSKRTEATIMKLFISEIGLSVMLVLRMDGSTCLCAAI